VKFGAHLPLIDFDGVGNSLSTLGAYVDAARDGGFVAVSANDHLVFQRPWLDGLVALASVIERAGPLTIATTIALPVIRGPVALARTAAALADLSEGRFVLGMGPGSSA
jgi:alkanesulfonate monooxygenase SsuD/methylene tetrahydromethanopterin reductase-like flavin-dependent oxidoreductase (luciferase family)